MPTKAARIFVAEAIGTFTLIFVGVLAIYSNGLVQYWVAQLLGASIAGFLAMAVVGQAGGTPDLDAIGAGVHHFFFTVQAPSLMTATRGGPAPAEERGEPTKAIG